jgi:exonuclease III
MTPDPLVIPSLNVRSLVGKIDEVRDSVVKHGVDIICIQQTWLNSYIGDTLVSTAGFSTVRVDSPNKSGYWCCGVYKGKRSHTRNYPLETLAYI